MGLVRGAVAEEPATLTSRGRPFALIVGLRESEDPCELDRLIRQARAQSAISRIRGQGRQTGLDRPTPAEIQEEIQAARARAANPPPPAPAPGRR